MLQFDCNCQTIPCGIMAAAGFADPTRMGLLKFRNTQNRGPQGQADVAPV
jgi:hypothetical protein